MHATGHQIVCLCRSVSEMENAQLLNPLMNSGHSVGFVFGQLLLCLMYILCWQSWMKYWFSCDTFVVRSVEFPELFRIIPCFFLSGSSNIVDVAHTGVIWSCFEVFSFNLFVACIVLVAHIIIELQFERKWLEKKSVDKDYPQKTILEFDYYSHKYPLRTSSQNIVFVPELSGASRNRYVFAPYEFHNTFQGFPESVRRRSVYHTRTDSKFQCL